MTLPPHDLVITREHMDYLRREAEFEGNTWRLGMLRRAESGEPSARNACRQLIWNDMCLGITDFSGLPPWCHPDRR